MRKYILLAINTLLLLMLFSNNAFSQGQHTTQGKEFWLSFGNNEVDDRNSTLQVRVVATKVTSVKFTFTQNNTSKTFNVNAGQVYTYTLTAAEKALVYSNATGASNKSMHIVSDENVSVFAINLAANTTDATNVLPITNYGTSYYHVSYKSVSGAGDGYTVIAIEDNTVIKDNGAVMTTLNKGQVYSRYFGLTDVTGRNITSDKPVAYFTTNSCINVPDGYGYCDCLFQQQVPVHSWGSTFLVPVTKQGKERIRVVASQDGTKITQTGGTVITGVGTGSLSLNAGQFVEMEVSLTNNGCYIASDKPVAVASFLTGSAYIGGGGTAGDPAMAWVPPIEQTVMNVAIAPFIAAGSSVLTQHHALIVTPTASKNSTTMTIGAGTPQALSGGTWRDNTSSGYSFYSIPLTSNVTYYFENAAGLSVMGYGLGSDESYYYLAASSARQLNPSFYINDIHFQDADGQTYCVGPFTFKSVANMTLNSSPGHIKWYINGTEVIAARDKVEWTKTDFPLDVPQEIKLVILDIYNQEFEMYSTITVVDPQPLQITGNPYICPPAANTVLTAESGPARYQWYKDGKEILGATQNTYTVTSANAGDYTVIGYYGTCASPMSDTITVINGCELHVTYDGNDHTGGIAPADTNVYFKGDDVTVKAHGNLVKTDAVFIGWSFGKTNLITLKTDEPSDLMIANDLFKITDDVMLYAVWAKDASGPGGDSDSIPDYLQMTVLYDGNAQTGGTAPVDANVYNKGDNVTVKAHGNLVKTGAVFIGWSFGITNLITSKAGEPSDLMVSNNQFTIITDTTLYAVWAKDASGPGGDSDSIPDYLQMTVLYDGNAQTGGTAPVDANVYNKGDNVTVKAHGNLVKTGAVFIGWSFGITNLITSKAGEPSDLMVSNNQFTIITDTTLYAVWAKDASGPGGDSDSIPDYLQMTVLYDGNAQTSGTAPVDANVYNSGDNVTVKANSNLVKTGAVFIGWSFGASSVIMTPSDEPSDLMQPGATFTIYTDTMLYAVWAVDQKGPGGGSDSIPDYNQFAVTYNGNGHTGGTAPVDANLYSHGDNVTAKTHGDLVKTVGTDPVVFAGWTPAPVSNVLTYATAADTTTAFVRAGGVFTITENTTLYAVWSTDANGNDIPDIFETGYHVVYDANGATGTAPVDMTTYLTGMTVTIKDKGSLGMTDATFIGWSFSSSAVVTHVSQIPSDLTQPDSTFVISGNRTLYAVWGRDANGPGGGSDSIPDYQQYGVTYNSNGAIGTTPVDGNLYNSGMNVTLKTEGNLAKTSFTFLGWNPVAVADVTTQAAEDALTLLKQPGEQFTITASTTWYAVWATDGDGNGIPDYKQVTITYEWGIMGYGIPETEIVEKGSTVEMIDRGFVMPSYVFVGWNTMQVPFITSLAMEAIITKMGKFCAIGDSLTITGDITLYAVWARDANGDGYPDYGGVIVKPKPGGVKTLGLMQDPDAAVLSESATGRESITGAHVWAYDNTLHIRSDKAARARIYTLGGVLFKQMDVAEGITSEPLADGIYIVEMDGLRYKVVVH